MIRKIDSLIDNTTMYRLMLYGLILLVGITLTFSAFGWLAYGLPELLLSLIVILGIGFAVKLGLGKVYDIPQNFESSLITCLILFFIMSIPTNLSGYIGLALAPIAALASKYIFVWRGAHIFNPAAVGALVVSLSGVSVASWWVATPLLFPFVTLIGLVILRKTRRFLMFIGFFLTSLIIILFQGVSIETALLSWPIMFLGTIMLTEPVTMPSVQKYRIMYAVGVGVLWTLPFHIGPIFASPHLALIVGNIFAAFVSWRILQKLYYVKSTKLSPTTFDVAFKPEKSFSFIPGQFMEWTLKGVPLDKRGNRRTFTIVTTPYDDYIHIVTKYADPGSQFKNILRTMKPGASVLAGRVSGDFVIPSDVSKPLIFIAGGIGITPFVTIISDLVKKGQKRSVVLFYFAAHQQEILYKTLWEKASRLGVVVVPLTKTDDTITKPLVENYVANQKPDVYLSGPPGMVRAYKKQLRQLDIPIGKVHTDYFSGY